MSLPVWIEYPAAGDLALKLKIKLPASWTALPTTKIVSFFVGSYNKKHPECAFTARRTPLHCCLWRRSFAHPLAPLSAIALALLHSPFARAQRPSRRLTFTLSCAQGALSSAATRLSASAS